MVSGSNCCSPRTVHVFLRNADGTFAPRRDVEITWPGLAPHQIFLARGYAHPHLLDWDGDGRADLVSAAHVGNELLVSAGPPAGRAEIAVTPVPLPERPDSPPTTSSSPTGTATAGSTCSRSSATRS